MHGMGASVVITDGEVEYQTHDVPIDVNDDGFYGAGKFFSACESVFKEMYKHYGVKNLVITGEICGGKVQVTGSMAYAPAMWFVVFDVSSFEINDNFNEARPVDKNNRKFIKTPLPIEPIVSNNIISINNFPSFNLTVPVDISYQELKLITDNQVKSIEDNCPVGELLNPDGNLICEGIVYTYDLPEYTTIHGSKRKAKRERMKAKGEKHKRKAGVTHTGIENKPFNDWAIESQALSNDRLQQMFDELMLVNEPSPRLVGEYVDKVLADIEKECYCFLDKEAYSNITDYLVKQALRKPIGNYFKREFGVRYGVSDE